MSTLWASTPVVDAIEESVRPASTVIFEGIEVSKIELDRLVDKNESLKNLSGPDAAQQYASVGRFLLRQHIASHEDEMGDWRLNRQMTANGCILLHNGLQHIRLLHHRDRRTVPHAGSNAKRREWFRGSAAADPELLEQQQNLILLWTIWNHSTTRLVHTLDEGRYASSPAIDLDVTVMREEEDFGAYSFNGDLSQPLGNIDSLDIDDAESTGTDDEVL
jgi:hypothetical protein